ncbi:helix-turn-helix domain-containing protein [Chloroflexota bacterium]
MELEGRLAISVNSAGKMLGLSRGSAYEAVKNGTLPSIRVGRRILVPIATLQRLLNGETTVVCDHDENDCEH